MCCMLSAQSHEAIQEGGAGVKKSAGVDVCVGQRPFTEDCTDWVHFNSTYYLVFVQIKEMRYNTLLIQMKGYFFPLSHKTSRDLDFILKGSYYIHS